jgi:hypothetical protein
MEAALRTRMKEKEKNYKKGEGEEAEKRWKGRI